MLEPMIEVVNLTKRYSGHLAVANESFTVERGQVVGLLGPNGAGKSTILRILSCFLAATSGTVRVAGYDVFTQADEVRRRIGYMPENNPLHLDMRVREYLKFRARLKGLGVSASHQRVDAVMEMCSLTEVQKRIIGQLSKGFRQRVGLADALVHDPELIILDEPTIGLDPNQLRNVRQLIKDLGRKHTILLSTHILPEVEATCSHVLILHQGRILASDGTDNLHRKIFQRSPVVTELSAATNDLQEFFATQPEVETCDIIAIDGDWKRVTMTSREGLELRPQICQWACEQRWPMRELTHGRHTLEDVFVKITRTEKEE